MSKIDAERERQRLRKLYAAMSDGELEELGEDPAALTEWGCEALRAEMVHRDLEWRERPIESRPEMPNDRNVLLVLRFYVDVGKAAEDKAKLKLAGIEADYLGETAPGPEGLITWVPSNGVRLLVHASELARSLELLGEKERVEEGRFSKDTEDADSDVNGKPVVLRTYRDITEAMVDRTALESAGIQCFLYDDNLLRLDWFVSNAIGGAKLVVSAKNAADATQILAEARRLGE